MNATLLFQSLLHIGSPQPLLSNGTLAPSLNWYTMSPQMLPTFSSAPVLRVQTRFNLILNNLLDVPHITENLFSVGQFAKDNDVFFEFHSIFCLVKSQGSNEIILKGLLDQDGLYKFSGLPKP